LPNQLVSRAVVANENVGRQDFAALT
jgi:hypothetical protein